MSESKSSENGLVRAINKNARMAVLTGFLLLILGILAVLSPLAAGASLMIIVGAILIIGGIGQCYLAFKAGALGEGLLILILGVIMIIAGGFLMSQPLSGLLAATLFLAAFFFVSGIFEIVSAFQLRPAEGWNWMLINGAVTLILGIMLWSQFPLSGAWAIGILFGLKMIFTGIALIVVGRGVRQMLKHPS